MQNRQKHIVVLTAVVSIAFAFPGCVSSARSRVPRKMHVSEIISSLRESHPDGIPASAAQAKMEQIGFKCQTVRDGTFVHKVRDPDESASVEPRKIEHIDFIECYRKTPSGWVTYFDTVALIHDSDTVVDVLSNWEAVGP